jgi:membrane-associated phospholipid phosphatase
VSGDRTAPWHPLGAGLATLAAILLSIAYLDRPVALWASGLDPAFVALCRRLTELGEGWVYLVPLGIAIATILVLRRSIEGVAGRRRLTHLLRIAVFLFAAIALSGIAADILKVLSGRARPLVPLSTGDFGWHPPGLEVRDQSFPSGHANTVAALAVSIGLLWPRWSSLAALYALAIMFTRIAVEWHYLSDLIAGAGLAVAVTLGLRAVFARRGWLFERHADGRVARRTFVD